MTVASLVTSGSREQLVHRFGRVQGNGASEWELIEVITYLAGLAAALWDDVIRL